MEYYCLRVTHPDYDGWWIVDPSEYPGEIVPIENCAFALANHAAAICAWEEPLLTEIQEDVLAAGFETTRIPVEAAKQYMS